MKISFNQEMAVFRFNYDPATYWDFIKPDNTSLAIREQKGDIEVVRSIAYDLTYHEAGDAIRIISKAHGNNKIPMSEVPQEILEKMRQNSDCFRKRH